MRKCRKGLAVILGIALVASLIIKRKNGRLTDTRFV